MPDGYFSLLPDKNQTWWQTATQVGTSVLGTVLDYRLKSDALQRGIINQSTNEKTGQSTTTYATTTGLPNQPPQANLGLTTTGLAGYSWGTIVILLVVVALAWSLLKTFLR